ncbi:hypothetical protein DASC09_036680 [Saccharomycopsis crataegensis]|uniref:Uncharacterized protein n=1 Tax=Saccharomycopsis crataegensis TaxID=43959 RepID=A0AAV5QQA8_9ASCO|nr:hypothetical protein DASC09_036680 [Saccharomycopsis crataegensis]
MSINFKISIDRDEKRLEELYQSYETDGLDAIRSNHEVIKFLTYHYMPHTPWTTSNTQKISTRLLCQVFPHISEEEHAPQYDLQIMLLETIRSSFRDLSPNPQKAVGGLRPQLGYSNDYYDSRQKWKQTPSKLHVISTLYFYLSKFSVSEAELRQDWNLYSSCVLKVLDDTDAVIKSLGCHILGLIIGKLRGNDVEFGRFNYFTQSGLDKVLLESISIGLSYLPTLSKIEDSRMILPISYSSSAAIIVKCSKTVKEQDERLLQFLNDEIINKVGLIMNLPQNEKITILQIYIRAAEEIINLLHRSRKVVLVLRKLLWSFVLNILTDGFLFLGIGANESGNDDLVNTEVFVEEVLKFLETLMEMAKERVNKYRYDIFTTMILFLERYEQEVNGDVHEDVSQFRKLVEMKDEQEKSLAEKQEKIVLKNSNIQASAEKILAIAVDSYEDKRQAQLEVSEIIDRKPFMSNYFLII